MPTNGFSIKPLKVKLSAGEQKVTEQLQRPVSRQSPTFSWQVAPGTLAEGNYTFTLQLVRSEDWGLGAMGSSERGARTETNPEGKGHLTVHHFKLPFGTKCSWLNCLFGVFFD